MKIKVFSFIAMVLLFSTTTVNAWSAAIDSTSTKFINEKVATMTEEQKEARINEIKNRVEEIKDMDKSQLSPTDRKELRTELKTMNREARAIEHGGV